MAIILYAGPMIDKSVIVFADYEGKHVLDTGTIKATQGMFRVRVDDIWYEVGDSTTIIVTDEHVEIFNAYLG